MGYQPVPLHPTAGGSVPEPAGSSGGTRHGATHWRNNTVATFVDPSHGYEQRGRAASAAVSCHPELGDRCSVGSGSLETAVQSDAALSVDQVSTPLCGASGTALHPQAPELE